MLTRQQRAVRDREVTLAWLTAAWARTDRQLPDLTDVLRAGQPQTSEEQAAVWQQAVEVFGFKVKTHNKRKARIIRMPARETA